MPDMAKQTAVHQQKCECIGLHRRVRASMCPLVLLLHAAIQPGLQPKLSWSQAHEAAAPMTFSNEQQCYF